MAPYLARTLERAARLWSRWWIGTAGSRFPTELRATQLLRTVTWIFLQFWWILKKLGRGRIGERKKKKKNLLSWIWWVIFSVRKKEKGTGGAGCVRAESAPAPYLKAVAFNSGRILAVGIAFGFQIWSEVKKKRKKGIFSNYGSAYSGFKSRICHPCCGQEHPAENGASRTDAIFYGLTYLHYLIILKSSLTDIWHPRRS